MKRLVIVFAVACGGSPKTAETVPVSATPSQPVQATPAAALAGACKRSDPFGPFELSGEEMLQRRGLGDRLVSDTVSSEEAPIQVCGVGGELAWLTNVTCADGSRPWGHDTRKAHAARRGSSTGQRVCNSGVEAVPVDIYEVPCPEKRYQVYMDMYECGPGEQFP